MSGRVSRIDVAGKVVKDLSLTHTADFDPDLEFLGFGSSVLGGSDVIATEVEEVIDLVVADRKRCA